MKSFDSIKGKVIAHRGWFNNENIVENTFTAFKVAVNLNLPIELDVRLTKDNKLVVFHDESLKRLCGVNILISSITFDELQNYKIFNTEQSIQTLKYILELVNGKVPILIEIKNTKKVKKLCEILNNELNDYKGEIFIQSFYPIILRTFKKINTNYLCGLLVNEDYNNKANNFLMTTKTMFKFCKIDFLSVTKKVVNNKRIQSYRKNYPLLVWTIKNKDELKKYSLSADAYICNNLPYDK